jgi:G:T/U-mismatch repair DNA glycosylase
VASKREPYTEEEDAVIARLWFTHTRTEIAHHLPGRSAESLTKQARRLGLPSKGCSKIVFTEEQMQRMCEMHTGGNTYQQIADEFETSLYKVFKILSSRGATQKYSWERKAREAAAAQELAPLEIAPGNFAVDARSYELITGRTPWGP